MQRQEPEAASRVYLGPQILAVVAINSLNFLGYIAKRWHLRMLVVAIVAVRRYNSLQWQL